MKPAPFEYIAPNTTSEVLEVINQHGSDSKLIAGGQSLVPAMNFRLVQPMMLVDLNKLSELNYIKNDANGGLLIGGMTRQRQMENSSLVRSSAPLLWETMPYIAHAQIRNRGTLGGSLAHADPAAELPVIMITLDCKIHVKSVNSDRWVEAVDFFQGIFTTDLKDDEVILEVAVPQLPERCGWAFDEFSRRKGDFALFGVAALVVMEDDDRCNWARLVYLNAGDRPIIGYKAAEILTGQAPAEDVIEAASEAASLEINPTGDIHATVPYVRHLAKILTKRALIRAIERAKS